MNVNEPFSGGGVGDSGGIYDYEIPNEPHKSLPFEIQRVSPTGENLYPTFAPEYYPDRFPQTKDKELNRNGQQCGGEDVTIKAVKNTEFHISGVVLAKEVPVLKRLQDHDGVTNVYSPLSPTGGVESYVKKVEIDATPEGYDGVFRQWRFAYTIDLVSTGKDEYERGTNAIVSAII
ncbi:hypothetical protein M193_gp025 [Halorubrum tailed phage 7]|uniref:Uncharacterized protein n=1 Tax=Halorubrum sodomense tailed virus 2 TaxID=1262527 RepID=L7TGK1_9CAUD|nr:hypothetical protein HSTV2_25 [Halorubrum sodomense tailed virus 2]YP_008060009.1 hypothetical protein M193_gp025 [Halorubrum tailed phage 7]AGC34294.1 hypothetical protein HSTV2_25 [Halorubrum sodomense tailed virus 2]AGM10897.1 hypothetical protein HRTV7_25 [Halorubrum tailed phage 7]UBF22282.1 hypothetical protein HRTV-11_gp25 [Halorubrum virus HRTV-11]